jgi:hypothetical protein
LRTAGRSGKLSKTITVTSNDPVSPRLMLKISGEIVTDVAVTPRSVWFGQLKKGETATKKFSVKVNDPEKFQIASVTVDNKAFSLKRVSGSAKGDAEYEVTFRGSRKRESISGRAEVAYKGEDETGKTKESKVKVSVRVEVVGDLRYPRYVRFMKKDGKFPAQTVVFSSRSGKPVKIKNATDPEGLLKLEIGEPAGPRAVIRAEVADPNKEFKTPRRRRFVVETTDRDEPKVEINYMIFERRDRRRVGPAGTSRPPARPRRPRVRPPVSSK